MDYYSVAYSISGSKRPMDVKRSNHFYPGPGLYNTHTKSKSPEWKLLKLILNNNNYVIKEFPLKSEKFLKKNLLLQDQDRMKFATKNWSKKRIKYIKINIYKNSENYEI